MDRKKERFHEFLNEHIGIIRKLCRGYTNTDEDFEDYVQEVCYQLWKSMDHFRGDSKSSTWVYRVTLNVCLYMIKKKERMAMIPTEQGELNLSLKDKTNSESLDPQAELLYSSISMLNPIDRAIIMLYLDRNEHAEIAEIVGLSTTNVGVKINRIKKRLKKIVDERVARNMG